MTDHVANCPFCNTPVKITQELLNQVLCCPNCREEICFSEEDFAEEEKRQAQLERLKIEYRFIILKLNEVEETLNYLWQDEGWQVVSQSTVFLSESSGGIGGLSAGTRTEGIAYTLKREKSV